ncbi:exported protein A EppA [Borreliella mayonii]|uniref:exported protein A EppA n=1 Tax=Borreliella mayonii TaxID=1674146 RepID=UPI00094E950C|nr:exported protein A EppA [Borreliella mayonii]
MLKLKAITCFIDGCPDRIFNYLIQLNRYKIDCTEEYRGKAKNKFEQSYFRDRVNTIQQILKQVLVDLSKD